MRSEDKPGYSLDYLVGKTFQLIRDISSNRFAKRLADLPILDNLVDGPSGELEAFRLRTARLLVRRSLGERN